MILNSMQQRVVASKKRITVITAQAGAGSSTALIYALIEVAKKDSSGLVLFCRATDSQTLNQGAEFSRRIPNSRFSPESQILTVKVGLAKKVKIKFVDHRYVFSDDYISAIAFDHHVKKDVLEQALKVAGRVYINDWSSTIPKAWGLELGLVQPADRGFKFAPYVENVRGFTVDNPGIDPRYVECLKKAPEYLKSTEL